MSDLKAQSTANHPLYDRFNGIYFTDTETVPKVELFTELDESAQYLFIKKFKKQIDDFLPTHPGIRSEDEALQILWEQNAALHAEFNQIVCISLGAFKKNGDFFVKNMVSSDEYGLLMQFKDILLTVKPAKLVAHNGKNFDFPLLSRKFIINGLEMPYILNTLGKKPWETNLIDTQDEWGFGEWNAKISLERLCYALNVPSPKQNMSGSEVGRYFYDNKLDEIGQYCGLDVGAMAACHLRMHQVYDNFKVV